MKHSLTVALRSLSVFVATLAAAVGLRAAETTLQLGNCIGSGVSSLVISGDEGGSSLFYPSSTMQAYAGCKISKVQIGFDISTSGGAVRLFLSHDISGEPFYTQTIESTSRGWNTVVLDTPYEIDGKPLYIGYTVKGVRYLRYCKALVANEEWIWQKDEEGWKKYEGQYSAAILAEVSGADVPRQNVRLGIVDMPAYVVKGQKICYAATFQNLGAETVKSLVVTYKKNGEEVKTETVEGLDVEPRREGNFTLGALSLDEEGVADISLGVTAVNGEQDAVADDNWSRTISTTCREEYERRKVLFEFFSTEKCTGCPAAHADVDELFKEETGFVEVGHHAGFYTDQYTVPQSVEYEWFYSTQYKGAPSGMFDRTNRSDIYPTLFKYGVPMVDIHQAKNAKTLYESCLKVPALATVDITTRLNGRNLSVDVAGRQLLPVEELEKVRLFVWLTEDSIYTDQQAGASKGFYHRFSMRESLTPTWGDEIDLGAGYSQAYTCVLPEEWNAKNVRAVAFLAKYNPEDKNDCVVLNANETAVDKSATAITAIPSGTEYLRWTLSSLAGDRVADGCGDAGLRGAMAQMPAGVYVVRRGNNAVRIVR